MNCVIVEAGKISQGITKNTTANLSMDLYSSGYFKAGKEKAKMYLTANETALRKYKSFAKVLIVILKKKFFRLILWITERR